jgi:hypothetical protein
VQVDLSQVSLLGVSKLRGQEHLSSSSSKGSLWLSNSSKCWGSKHSSKTSQQAQEQLLQTSRQLCMMHRGAPTWCSQPVMMTWQPWV